MGIEFILFLILGLVEFVPLSGGGKMVAMIVYIVLMALWLLGFVAGFQLHLPALR